MQFFKLLALVPMAASLVAATSAQPGAAHVALLARHQEMMKPTCDTSSISRVTADLKLNVDVDIQAAAVVYCKYSRSVKSVVSNITTDVSAHASATAEVQAKLMLQVIANLKAALDVSVK